jgi:hypothetical protein
VHDRLLLILSADSMSSEWVMTEIAKARKQETRNPAMLVPVRLVDFGTVRDWECFDADTGKDAARETREYQYPTSANWKDHQHYQPEFERPFEGPQVRIANDHVYLDTATKPGSE